MITKNSVMKIQNLVVNHESRQVKSNFVIHDENCRFKQICFLRYKKSVIKFKKLTDLTFWFNL